jgi:hypothetical protein
VFPPDAAFRSSLHKVKKYMGGYLIFCLIVETNEHIPIKFSVGSQEQLLDEFNFGSYRSNGAPALRTAQI